MTLFFFLKYLYYSVYIIIVAVKKDLWQKVITHTLPLLICKCSPVVTFLKSLTLLFQQFPSYLQILCLYAIMSSFISFRYCLLTSFSDRRRLIFRTTLPSSSYHHKYSYDYFQFLCKRSLIFVCVMCNLFETMKINVSPPRCLIATFLSILLLYLPKGKKGES